MIGLEKHVALGPSLMEEVMAAKKSKVDEGNDLACFKFRLQISNGITEACVEIKPRQGSGYVLCLWPIRSNFNLH